MARPPLTLALIVNLHPPYVVGGNEMLARDVVGALRARGHAVHVLTGRGRDLPKDGFTHAALDLDLDRKEHVFLGAVPLTPGRVVAWHLYNHRSYRGVRRALEALRPDLVIAWNLHGASMAPLVAAKRSGVPVVAQPADKWLLHGLVDVTAVVPPDSPARGLALRMARALLQPVVARLARPDYVLAISEFVRGLHTAAGFPRDRSRAIHLGVPVASFPARDAVFPEARPWRLVFAGQLWEGKGPQVAVEAVRILAGRDGLPETELDVFGTGSPHFLDHLRRLIDEKGVAGRVRLRGFVPRGRLAEELRAHDLFLFCSTWDEPFSSGLLEALCAGLPTVATTTGGTPEAIADGRNGLLVPPNDPQALAGAVARLMGDRELYLRLGREAAEDVRRRWTFEGYVDRLEETYGAIVAAHRAGRPLDLG